VQPVKAVAPARHHIVRLITGTDGTFSYSLLTDETVGGILRSGWYARHADRSQLEYGLHNILTVGNVF